MIAIRQTLRAVLITAIVLAMVFAGYAFVRNNPQDTPWAPLQLDQPTGVFTGRKLTALTGDFAKCRGLLDRAGVSYDVMQPITRPHCSVADAVRLKIGDVNRVGFSPAGLSTSCAVAASMLMWEWNVVQPAAQKLFNSRVTRIRHFGSYNCRRMYGRDSGPWSEHATADAIDIAGFDLADGTRISVADDWKAAGKKTVFLRDVRDGACRLFATVLSPDYNAAHRDHLHLDQAQRGKLGWRACR